MENKLTDKDKLELVNSMEIVDSSASSGELEYVLVENNTHNRNILTCIGCSEEEINDYMDADEESIIDISGLVFMKVDNIHWFDGNKFLDYVPEGEL